MWYFKSLRLTIEIINRTLTVVFTTAMVFSFSSLSSATCVAEIPESTPDSQLIDNGNGTVTDGATGLMWFQCLDGQVYIEGSCAGPASTYTWQEALHLPVSLNGDGDGFADFTDWRLPNVKELLSLVEKACVSPAANTARFPGIPAATSSVQGSIWTNSLYGNDRAWIVNIHTGLSGYEDRDDDNKYVRFVRAGQ